MRKITISSKKATKGQLVAGMVAVAVLLCVRMHTVVAMAQAVVPTSSMVGQEIWVVMGIVALWYLVWGGIVLSLAVRVAIRLLALYISK